MNVLVADDQRSARRVLVDLLSADPLVVVQEAASLEEARAALAQRPFDLAFVDLRLRDDPRDRSGLDLVKEIKERTSALSVMITGLADISEVRAAMRAGAHDYLLKEGLCEEVIDAVLEEVRSRRLLEREVLTLRSRVQASPTSLGLIGHSQAIERLREVIRRVAVSDRPALITGPSGAGKELVVRAIHALGPDAGRPLLDLNCGALPEALVESQLFGYERGAFTGADRRGQGLLASVGQGTLFLDEIAELPLTQQPKLLRVLETRRFRAVGSTVEQTFEGRIIAATHATLEERVRRGTFREDLFHRLAVLRVRVPPLDERREDIPSLIAHFAKDQPRELTFSEDAVALLCARPWPGNVRELRNLVDQVGVFVDERPVGGPAVELLLTPPDHGRVGQLASAVLAEPHDGDRLALVTNALVAEAMRLAEGNKTAAARLLGVHRKVVERRMGGDDATEE